jgi:hypothetical protein
MAIENIVTTTPSFKKATIKAAHLMIPVEGQRYLLNNLEKEHPYVKFLAVCSITGVQAITIGPTAYNIISLFK